MADSGPSVRQRRIGKELKGWRIRAGLTQEQVATQLAWNAMRVSRAESRGAGMSDIIAMATVLRIDEDERDRVVGLAQQAREATGWWTNYAADVVPHYVADLAATEADAQRARFVETTFIPGLLQTDAYMDALMRGGTSDPLAPVIEERRRVRQQRQAVLDGSSPLQLHAVIHEHVIRLPIAPPADMAEQLDHLIDRAGQDNITIQVVPEAKGAYPGMGIAWQMFSYDGTTWASTFIDHLQGGLYMEDDDLIAVYSKTFGRLAKLALDPRKSVRFIKETRTALAK